MKMNYDQRDKRSIPIRTINMAIEALEKQIPGNQPNRFDGYCPGRLARQPINQQYCHHCGQALKWEQEGEMKKTELNLEDKISYGFVLMEI